MPSVTRPQIAVGAVIALVVVLLGIRQVGSGRRTDAVAVAPSQQRGDGTVRIERSAGGRSAVVHVAGAVRAPGVYRMASGARVRDAVERAGGARTAADLNAINLAARVVDGQQVVVPRRVPAAANAAGTNGAASDGGQAEAAATAAAPISLNTASAEQLDTLEGVGPATATKILAWRREHGGFRSVEDLGQVPGIGPKRLAALRPRVQP